jgi:hypothetical protein
LLDLRQADEKPPLSRLRRERDRVNQHQIRKEAVRRYEEAVRLLHHFRRHYKSGPERFEDCQSRYCREAKDFLLEAKRRAAS